jgi:hypothetical protein
MYTLTAISLTFIAGTAAAYSAPVIWNKLTPVIGRVPAMRTAFAVISGIALICMYLPVIAINEKKYINVSPVQSTMISSLVKTFKNKNFRIFVGSDIFY